jgi:hypothetical protein
MRKLASQSMLPSKGPDPYIRQLLFTLNHLKSKSESKFIQNE